MASARAQNPSRASAGFYSSSTSFYLPKGQFFTPTALRGYYIDFTVKAAEPDWPQSWRERPDRVLHVWPLQHGLGCYERYLAGDGDQWLASAIETADRLLVRQEPRGRLEGAWLHRRPFPHTFRLPVPWISAMAQGEGASLFARVYGETRNPVYRDAAERALAPLAVSVSAGGVRTELGGYPFVEEYPTTPSSFVLNGAIFAIWGVRDVELALGYSGSPSFHDYATGLMQNIHRWDTAYWSRYDLYPHPLQNIASSFYHSLHINQLEVMDRLIDFRPFRDVAMKWRQSADSVSHRTLAFAHKAAFRLLVPRNRVLSRLALTAWSPSKLAARNAP